MSEMHGETLALSSTLADSSDSLVDSMVESPLSFTFARQRWQNGVMSLLGSMAMAATGGFLLSEIPRTPGLKVQMAILGVLLLLGSIALLYRIAIDLFGAVRVDRKGIHVRPAFAGFSAPWKAVQRWEVADDRSSAYLPCLKVWVDGKEHPHVVPGGMLSHHDLRQLRKLLIVGRPE